MENLDWQKDVATVCASNVINGKIPLLISLNRCPKILTKSHWANFTLPKRG